MECPSLLLLAFILRTSRIFAFPNYSTYDYLKDQIVPLINKTFNDRELSIDTKCREMLNTYIDSPNSGEQLERAFNYSSFKKNDIGKYAHCQRNDSTIDYIYYIISIYPIYTAEGTVDVFSLFKNDKKSYKFGLCIRAGCNEEGIREIVINMNNLTNDFLGVTNQLGNNTLNIDAFDFTNKYKEIFSYFKQGGPLLMCGVFFIYLVFVLFASIFSNFLHSKITNKNKPLSLNQMTLSTKSEEIKVKKDSFCSRFFKSLRVSENFEEYFSLKDVTLLNNSSGLGYIKGLRGICILFYILGITYTSLDESKLFADDDSNLFLLINNYLFALVVFGIRHAPRILFSCSGFMTTSKFFYFLDDKLEGKISSEYASNSSSISINEDEKDSEKFENITKAHLIQMSRNLDQNLIGYNFLFRYLLSQLYLYVLGCFVILYYFFLFFPFFSFFITSGAYVLLMKSNAFDAIRKEDVISHFFFYGNFDFSKLNDNGYDYNSACIFCYFYAFFNEATFFVMTLPVLFISYKKKFKINIIICFLILVVLVIKITLFYCFLNQSYHLEGKDNIIPTYSTLFFISEDDYKYFFYTPLINYSFYLIGVIFGLIIYVIQRGITPEDVEDGDKSYLKTSAFIIQTIRFLTACKSIASIAIGILLSLVIIFFMHISLSVISLFYPIDGETITNKFLKNGFINFFYLIDTEILTILIHFILLFFYLKGKNINRLFSSKFLNLLNKNYINVLLNGKVLISYLLNLTEILIPLSVEWVVTYFFISMVFILANGIIFVPLFEYPYKRISKLIYNFN